MEGREGGMADKEGEMEGKEGRTMGEGTQRNKWREREKERGIN